VWQTAAQDARADLELICTPSRRECGTDVAPLVTWPLYVGDLLVWHMPTPYAATLQHASVHMLEHLCFLGTGLLFWWVIVEPLPGPPRLHDGVRLLYAGATVLPTTALGALFTFAGTPWYPFYAAEPRL
jgi:cytochrome c oxidase assembly factor CtaG